MRPLLRPNLYIFDSQGLSQINRESGAKLLPPQTAETIWKIRCSDKVDAKKHIT